MIYNFIGGLSKILYFVGSFIVGSSVFNIFWGLYGDSEARMQRGVRSFISGVVLLFFVWFLESLLIGRIKIIDILPYSIFIFAFIFLIGMGLLIRSDVGNEEPKDDLARQVKEVDKVLQELEELVAKTETSLLEKTNKTVSEQVRELMTEILLLANKVENKAIQEKIHVLNQDVKRLIFLLQDNPSKCNSTKLLNYYLPELINLLKKYDRFEDLGVESQVDMNKFIASVDAFIKEVRDIIQNTVSSDVMMFNADTTVLGSAVTEQISFDTMSV